jgi:hypothetical protein
METDHNVCNANRFDNGHKNRAFDNVTGKVGAPWIVKVDVIVGDASIATAERGAKLGQEGVAIPTDRRGRRLGGRVGGHDTLPPIAASIQDGFDGRKGGSRRGTGWPQRSR